MQNLFSYWKVLRYIVCAIVAAWGFIMIFTQGVDSGGKILLLIAGIGVSSTMLFDMFHKYMSNKNKMRSH